MFSHYHIAHVLRTYFTAVTILYFFHFQSAAIIIDDCSDPFESFMIAYQFRRYNYDVSECPRSEIWLHEMQQLDPGQNKVFIDLGYNKGYNFAVWAAIWLPESNISPAVWHDAIVHLSKKHQHFFNSHHSGYFCGICSDCEIKIPKVESKQTISNGTGGGHGIATNSNLRLIGIDLNPELKRLVRNVTKYIAKRLQYRLQLHLIVAAGSNVTGNVKVMDCTNFIGESCKTASSEVQRIQKTISLPMVTIDSLIVPLSLDVIDILMIDAEGNDPLVLIGAMTSLSERRIRLLIFEYHELCPWPNYPLKLLVDKLASFGYVCYFEGFHALWRLTGNCWDDAFEIHRWSNILCVLSSDIWYQVTERFRATKHKPYGLDSHAISIEENWLLRFSISNTLRYKDANKISNKIENECN